MSASNAVAWSRRQCLLALAGGVSWPGAWASPPRAAPASAATLVAAWEADNQYRVGLIRVQGDIWSVQQSVAVPTRPHALLFEVGGSVLIVARRPGDWLLRWHPDKAQQQWHWIDGDRRFNGHAVASGSQRFTTETDLDSAQGLLGVRHARNLEKTAEWATHGMDPHELLVLPEPVGSLPTGTLMVANGGIPTLPETGRSKRGIARMDASLVALSPESGELLGQWRVTDPFLSVRHLAWDPVTQRLGVALQAEHPSEQDRWRAPVFAVWDGANLTSAPESPDLRGYGGAVAAAPGGGFLVGCPRANVLSSFDAKARWLDNLTLPDACAVAASNMRWWAGGSSGILHNSPTQKNTSQLASGSFATPRWDNHWQVWPAASDMTHGA